MFEGINSFNIMTFDGGGVRGALSISLLNRLKDHYPTLIEKTSLMGGTSTGSFIAIGLAHGLSPMEIMNIYTGEGLEYIFSKSYPEIIRSKYNNKKLKEVLLNIFPKDLTLKDLSKFVVIPTFYLGDKKNNWEPIFYSNIPGSSTANSKVIDVMLSSSAAPIYFPIYKNHIDGGIIANDPSLACLVHALDDGLARELKNIKLLSIGTGYTYNYLDVGNPNWGAIDWILNKNPSHPIVALVLEGNSKFSQSCTSKLLDENYIRLNPKIDIKIGLDDYKSIDKLLDIGESCYIESILSWIGEKWR